MRRFGTGILVMAALLLARPAAGTDASVGPGRPEGAAEGAMAPGAVPPGAAEGAKTAPGGAEQVSEGLPVGSGEGAAPKTGGAEGEKGPGPAEEGAGGIEAPRPVAATGDGASRGADTAGEFPGDDIAEEAPSPSVPDPLEPLNRLFFVVNDKAYFWVLKPVAKGYEKAVPLGVRTSIGNFFANLAMPIRFMGHLLQGKVKGAGTELARFAINSTLGVAGLFDAADGKLGLKGHDEDLGQAFAVWGLGHGLYIVLPFLGPSSLRDAAGLAGDSVFLDPLNYFNDVYTVIGARVIKAETSLTFRLGAYEALVEDAVDPYAAVRDAYVQHRAKEVGEQAGPISNE